MYRTPRACYRKAPVRRETALEQWSRQRDQLPDTQTLSEIFSILEGCHNVGFTVNNGLVSTGPGYYVLTPTR